MYANLYRNTEPVHSTIETKSGTIYTGRIQEQLLFKRDRAKK